MPGSEEGDATAVVDRRTVRTARSLVALGVGEIVGKLATLVLIVAIARVLGPDEFGAFSFALSAGSLVAILPSWGFDPMVIQRGSADRSRLPALLAQLITLRAAITIPVLVIMTLALLGDRGGGGAGWAMVLVLVACLTDTFADGYRAIATATEMQGRIAAVLILQRVLGTGLVLGALALHQGLPWVCAGYLAGSVAGLVGMVVSVRHLGVRPGWQQVTSAGIRDLGRASWTVGMHSVVSMALFRVDAVMLGILAGDAAVGLYAAAYRLLETVLFVAHNVSRVVFPRMAAARDRDGLARGWERGLALLASVFLPYAAVLSLRGHDVLGLVYGPAFAGGAVPVLAWLAVAPLLFGVAFVATDVLLARGPNGRLLIGSGCALLLNVVLNVVLIPMTAGLGAAIATTASYLLEALILGWFVVVLLDGRMSVRGLWPALGGTIGASAVMVTALPLLPALLLAAVLYLVIWWALGRWLDPEQVRVLMSVLGVARPAGSARGTRPD